MQLYFTTILLFHCILIQIKAALVSINGKNTTLKNILKIPLTPKFWTVV